MLFVFGLKGLIHLIALVDLFALPVYGKTEVSIEQCEYEIEKCEYEISPSRSLCEDMIKADRECVEGIEWTPPEGYVAKRKFEVATTPPPKIVVPPLDLGNSPNEASSNRPAGDGAEETPSTEDPFSTPATLVETTEIYREENPEIVQILKPKIVSFQYPAGNKPADEIGITEPTPTEEEIPLVETSTEPAVEYRSTILSFYGRQPRPRGTVVFERPAGSTMGLQRSIGGNDFTETRQETQVSDSDDREPQDGSVRSRKTKYGGDLVSQERTVSPTKTKSGGVWESQERTVRPNKTKSGGDWESQERTVRPNKTKSGGLWESQERTVRPNKTKSGGVWESQERTVRPKKTKSGGDWQSQERSVRLKKTKYEGDFQPQEGSVRPIKTKSVDEISTIPIEKIKRIETPDVIEAGKELTSKEAASEPVIPVKNIKGSETAKAIESDVVGSADRSAARKLSNSPVADISTNPVDQIKQTENAPVIGTDIIGSQERLARRKKVNPVADIPGVPVKRLKDTDTTQVLDTEIIGAEEGRRSLKKAKAVSELSKEPVKRIKPAETTRELEEDVIESEESALKRGAKAADFRDPMREIGESDVGGLIGTGLVSEEAEDLEKKRPKSVGEISPIPVKKITETNLDTDVLKSEEEYESAKTTAGPRGSTTSRYSDSRRIVSSEERFKKSYYSDEDGYYNPKGSKKNSGKGKSAAREASSDDLKASQGDDFKLHRGNSRSLTNGGDLGDQNVGAAAPDEPSPVGSSGPESFQFTRDDIQEFEDVETNLKKNFFQTFMGGSGRAQSGDDAAKNQDDDDVSNEGPGMLGGLL